MRVAHFLIVMLNVIVLILFKPSTLAYFLAPSVKNEKKSFITSPIKNFKSTNFLTTGRYYKTFLLVKYAWHES
jgi:hypothetical protein